MSSVVGMEVNEISKKGMNQDEELVKVAEALSQVLADTFTLYLKTHNCTGVITL